MDVESTDEDYVTAEEDYVTAEEDDGLVLEGELELLKNDFPLWISADGTKWFLPRSSHAAEEKGGNSDRCCRKAHHHSSSEESLPFFRNGTKQVRFATIHKSTRPNEDGDVGER